MPKNFTEDDLRMGKMACAAHEAKMNPADWVEDEDVWEKAKEAASKSYEEDDPVYWPSVVVIYKNMGGGIKAANETNKLTDAIAFVNESAFKHGAGGWVQLAPYGTFPNVEGLQKFEKADAVELVNRFTTLVPYDGEPLAVKAARMTMGLPFYIGHPDHPRFADKYKDERAYGRIKKVEARDDGLWANIKWNEEGKKLIESEAFHGHSINWGCVKENGHVRPVALKSVGFTNSPAIPVMPIETANIANEQQKQNMQEILTWVLNALGLVETAELKAVQDKFNAVANEAKAGKETAEKLTAAETKLKEAAERQVVLANEKSAGDEKAKKAEADLANERTRAERAEAALRAKETELANERKRSGDTLIKLAIETGRISLAEAKQVEKDLANEFDKTLERVTKMMPKIHVISVTATRNMGTDTKRGAEEKLIANIHADMRQDSSLTYAAAWAKREREHPEEFIAAGCKVGGN